MTGDPSLIVDETRSEDFETDGNEATICQDIIDEVVYYVTEEHGRHRVHLLPEDLRILNSDETLPVIEEVGVKESVEVLGKLLGCRSYDTAYFEFWFLVTTTEILMEVQKMNMTQRHQKVLVTWFCYFMKKLQASKDHTDFLEEMKGYFKLASDYIVDHQGVIPTPEILDQRRNSGENEQNKNGISHDSQKNIITPNSKKQQAQKTQKESTLNQSGNSPFLIEENLKTLYKIAQQMKNVFGDEIRFMLMSSIFKMAPLVTDVYSPYSINVPKTILSYSNVFDTEETNQEKGGSKKDANKYEKKKVSGQGKETKKKESKGDMNVKTTTVRDKNVSEVTEEDRRDEIDLRDYILPLQMAVEPSFFDQFWPEQVLQKEEGKKEKKKNK